jgi:hypothetical protein
LGWDGSGKGCWNPAIHDQKCIRCHWKFVSKVWFRMDNTCRVIITIHLFTEFVALTKCSAPVHRILMPWSVSHFLGWCSRLKPSDYTHWFDICWETCLFSNDTIFKFILHWDGDGSEEVAGITKSMINSNISISSLLLSNSDSLQARSEEGQDLSLQVSPIVNKRYKLQIMTKSQKWKYNQLDFMNLWGWFRMDNTLRVIIAIYLFTESVALTQCSTNDLQHRAILDSKRQRGEAWSEIYQLKNQ